MALAYRSVGICFNLTIIIIYEAKISIPSNSNCYVLLIMMVKSTNPFNNGKILIPV